MHARRPRSLGRQYERSTLLHGLWQALKMPGSCRFPSPVQHGRTHGRLCDRDGLFPWCRSPSLHPCTISGRSSLLRFRLTMSHRLAQHRKWAEWCSMYLRSICYCHTFLRYSWTRRRRSCALALSASLLQGREQSRAMLFLLGGKWSAAWNSAMGKQKQVRKFGAVKRLLNPNDTRLYVIYYLHQEIQSGKVCRRREKGRRKEEACRARRLVHVLPAQLGAGTALPCARGYQLHQL